MSESKVERSFWETRFKLRRRRHRIRKQKSERPDTGRRSIKQVIKDYRCETSKSPSSTGSIPISKRRNGQFAGFHKDLGQIKSCSYWHSGSAGPFPEPIGVKGLRYREEPSTESFVMDYLPRFKQIEDTSITKANPAQESFAREQAQSEPLGPIGPKTDFLYHLENSATYKQHFAPRTETAARSTVESVISTTTNSSLEQPSSEKNNSSVMKKIENSILSFFGCASSEQSSSRLIKGSDTVTAGSTSNGMLSFFSYRRSKATNKWELPAHTATEEIDYSIYGSQAKYFM